MELTDSVHKTSQSQFKRAQAFFQTARRRHANHHDDSNDNDNYSRNNNETLSNKQPKKQLKKQLQTCSCSSSGHDITINSQRSERIQNQNQKKLPTAQTVATPKPKSNSNSNSKSKSSSATSLPALSTFTYPRNPLSRNGRSEELSSMRTDQAIPLQEMDSSRRRSTDPDLTPDLTPDLGLGARSRSRTRSRTRNLHHSSRNLDQVSRTEDPEEDPDDDDDDDDDDLVIDYADYSDDVPLIDGNNALGGRKRQKSQRHKRTCSSLFKSTSKNLTRSTERTVSHAVARASGSSYPYVTNAISNAKYTPVTFLPVILYEQFKFFFNLYFLLVALSQAIPVLRIGYLSSYVVPLAFVLSVTMGKEAWDDIQRRRRDREANSELYDVIDAPGHVFSKDLKVGQVLRLQKDQRIPADLVLLSSSTNSEAFIKTDQLDGETDWKLRLACPLTQGQPGDLLMSQVKIIANPPEKNIHEFLGTLHFKGQSIGLSVDNTLWANTVLASAGTVLAMVVYTGKDTRQAMNTSTPNTKIGLLELEINSLSKILCVCVLALSIGLEAIHGFDSGDWYVNIMRFLILFSTIIPVSLRVNLDLAKSLYAYLIEHDKSIAGTIVRTSTIPEDLGRIEYLLTDKTGTLTMNDMELKKIHVGTVSYTADALDEVRYFVGGGAKDVRRERENKTRVMDLVQCLAICHSVTPSYDDYGQITYQAASPDEIAIVKWTSSVDLSLTKRDRTSMTLLNNATNTYEDYKILEVFPFNSDNKRMGIIVSDHNGEIWFFLKGADVVMTKIVQHNDWLDEEIGNMAREGLRTLVIGRKKLSTKFYNTFSEKYKAAAMSMHKRESAMSSVVGEYLEHDLELLGITGVEDRLQKNVKSSLELLRNAGIKIWMLTGDKVETARCVAVSAKLVSRGQFIHTVTKVNSKDIALEHIQFIQRKPDSCLLIDGESLSMFMNNYRQEFVDAAVKLPAVIACRCTPQQKADVAMLIKDATKKRVCCIGDGGNDVSMIQAADVGIGIVGKEGKQASLAADFSVTQFYYLTKLLVLHGRNSYKRSAQLAQFIIHRGLIISICQTVYSIASSFEPLALFQGWLMVGYATVYTMAPVFCLVLDQDVDEDLVKLYPELYKELTTGNSLSYKTFFVWVFISIYQGCIIQGLSQLFIGINNELFTRMVAVSFTALVLNELLMVFVEYTTLNFVLIATEVITFGLFVGSYPFLGDYYDLEYMQHSAFYWQVFVITAASLLPIWAAKVVQRRLWPPNYAKVQQA